MLGRPLSHLQDGFLAPGRVLLWFREARTFPYSPRRGLSHQLELVHSQDSSSPSSPPSFPCSHSLLPPTQLQKLDSYFSLCLRKCNSETTDNTGLLI